LGPTDNRKIITIVFVFLLASVFVYGIREPVQSVKKGSLNQALAKVDGWKAGPHIPYDKEVVKSLALDDYVNRVFVKDDNSIALYVGYYLTSKKVGAAHDPLVCFPGQGWSVSGRNKGIVEIDGDADLKVSYSTMMVNRGVDNTNVILYWFQAYETANTNTLSQKITAMKQKITDAREDNAFVRLTCSTAERSKAECIESMRDFIKGFYPVFLNYIRE